MDLTQKAKQHIMSHKGWTLLVIIILLSAIPVQAQQYPRYSQYTMNEFLLNPAVAGAEGQTIISLSGRKEWVGFGDGNTPQTYSVSAQTRLLKRSTAVVSAASGNKLQKASSGRVGLGASLFIDKNGAVNRTGIQFSYAYHIFLRQTQLSFGLTSSIVQMQIQKDKLDFYNNSDEIMLALAGKSIWIPDFAFGVHLMNDNFQLGASAVQLLQSAIVFGDFNKNANAHNIQFKRNYFLFGSYHHELRNRDWEYEPSFLLKMYDPLTIKPEFSGPKVQVDLSLKLFYRQKFWFGASYRTSNDYVVFGGLKYNNLYFSYSFDYGNNEITQYSYGSHEICVSAKFGESVRRLRWKERY